MRIDSHHHLWRFDPLEYGWIDEKATALRRSYLHEDLAIRDCVIPRLRRSGRL